MTRRTIDFDAFRAEQKREPIELTLGGRVYELPSGLPASLALDVLRLSEKGDDETVDIHEIMPMGAAIFGSEETFRRVLAESGIMMDELADLVKMVVRAYTTDDEEPDPNGEAQP